MTAPWAVNLKKLQDKDLRIRVLTGKLAMIPKEQINLKNQAAANRTKVEKAKNDVLELELQQKKAESRINAHKETIHKLETQSNMVKKNTEYQAMLQQISDYKNKISDEESLIIDLIDKIEQSKKTYRRIAEDIKFENASLKSEFLDLEKLITDVKADIASLQSERQSLTAPIEASVLNRYESLLKRGVGKPLALVQNGICENCHMRITPQTLSSAMKKLVTFCDNCQHFIYMED